MKPWIFIILLGIFSLALLLTAFLASAENDPSPAGGEVNGDWNVTDTRAYEDCTIIMNGNLMVKDGGALTFRNVTLKMNCTKNGERKIEVEDGGKLLILDKDGDRNTTIDGSKITAVDLDYHYLFIVNKGAEFEMKNSFLSGCGYRRFPDDNKAKGLFIEAENVLIEGNNFTKCYYALGFNNTREFDIKNNTFFDLGKYYGMSIWHSTMGSIRNNLFEGSALWITNSSLMEIHDNEFRNETVGTAIVGTFWDSTISYNNFEGNKGGLLLSYSPLYPISERNVIEKNIFKNNSFSGIEVSKKSSNNLFRNNFYTNNYKTININGFPIAPDIPENNIFENEIIENSNLLAVTISYSNNNSFVNCTILNSSMDLLSYHDSHNNSFINSTFSSYDIRDTSYIVVDNYLTVQTLNSTDSPLPGVDVLIEQDGAPVYSTPGFGGTDPKTDSFGKTPQLVLTDRVINATSEIGTNTTVTVRKGNWQETRIVNTSISHTEVFRTPVIEFENSGVSPDSGDQDTVFNFTVTLSAPAEYCRFLLDGEEFGMTGQGNDSYYLGKTLGPGNYTYSFLASNSLEVFNSLGFPLTVSDTIAPPPVSGLTVSDMKNGTFLLSWSASIAEDFDHYRIYYSTQNFSTTEGLVSWAHVSGSGNTTGTIPGLDIGMTYYFVVTAVDAHGNENQSIQTVEGISEPFLVNVNIESLEITPEKPEEGRNVKIEFTVKNTGEAGIPELLIFVKIDGKELYNHTFTGFYVNGTLSDSFDWKAVKGGHTVEIFVIRDGKTETRERGFKVEEKGDRGGGFIPGFEVVVLFSSVSVGAAVAFVTNVYQSKRS